MLSKQVVKLLNEQIAKEISIFFIKSNFSLIPLNLYIKYYDKKYHLILI